VAAIASVLIASFLSLLFIQFNRKLMANYKRHKILPGMGRKVKIVCNFVFVKEYVEYK